ncbi:MAG TPA: hypothetical protein VEB66_08260 [Opitutaceae bacterium]|nr:hypothetical protein [Opitutaceae bacterium]
MKAARPILLLALLLRLTLAAPAAPGELDRLDPADPAWTALAARLGREPDGVAEFEEERTFRFRSKPVLLAGIARVSARHGLSLEYTRPEPRIVIVDSAGVLFREPGGDRAAPRDPRARLMNEAMLHVLRFDLAALGREFDLEGGHGAEGWQLALRPRSAELRRTLSSIEARGDETGVRRLVLRRADRQTIEIRIGAPRPMRGGFPAEDVRRFFRGSP